MAGHDRRRPASVRARRGPRRPVRAGAAADPPQRRAERLRPHQLGARRRPAAEHHRAADPLRGLGPRGRRAGVVQRVQRHPPVLPRPAHREHRHRAEHDRGERADGDAARAVAVAGARAAGAQPGDRARQAPRRGEGRAAGGLLELQVGVLREHVARAAHAAQQPADPRSRAPGQRRAQPHRHAGRVRERHPLLGHRPAGAAQRHPRPREGRVGHGRARDRPAAARRVHRGDRAGFPSRRRPEGRRVHRRARARASGRDPHRLPAPAPGAEEPARERVQVHRPGRGPCCA